MKPYETLVIKPRKYIANICEFLDGKNDYAQYNLKSPIHLQGFFLGWETRDKLNSKLRIQTLIIQNMKLT